MRAAQPDSGALWASHAAPGARGLSAGVATSWAVHCKYNIIVSFINKCY